MSLICILLVFDDFKKTFFAFKFYKFNLLTNFVNKAIFTYFKNIILNCINLKFYLSTDQNNLITS